MNTHHRLSFNTRRSGRHIGGTAAWAAQGGSGYPPSRSVFLRLRSSTDSRTCGACDTTSGPTVPQRGGFTLIELIVVVGMLGLLFLLLVPGLAHTGPNVRAIQCLSNLAQMQAGANMYAADFNDLLLPNAPLGCVDPHGNKIGWCPPDGESWGPSTDNTNYAAYKALGLGPYVRDVRVYKCPGDTIPSDNGQRIRSFSMNCAMVGDLARMSAGTYKTIGGYIGSWKTFAKTSDLGGSLPPAKAFVFCEESMYTLNDGYLQLNFDTPQWSDVPGSYHNGAMGVSFADGHVELHQWVCSYVQVPVRYGVTMGTDGRSWVPSSGADADWVWTRDHASARK